MNKLGYLILGVAGLAITSCSQNELVGPTNGDGNFQITVQLPADLATRSIGNGLTASTLKFAVYDVTNGTPTFSFQDVAYFGNSLTTTVNLNLINGKSYQLAFFACSPNAGEVYTFSPEATTPNIFVDYSKMTSAGNVADDYDCFFKITDAYTVGTSENPSPIVLDRPMAQLNWGTSEVGANYEIDSTFGEDGENIVTNVTFETPLYNTLNILDGSVDEGETISNVVFTAFAAPYEETFPVANYTYVAMNYVLAPAEQPSTYDVSIDIYNATPTEGTPINDADVASVPLQGNYRTNIYGTLLSSDVQLTVTKDPNWNTPDFNEPLTWNGEKSYPVVSNNTAKVTAPSDLAGIADMVSGTNLPAGVQQTDFAGVTITIESDIDMGGTNGMIFPGIGNANFNINQRTDQTKYENAGTGFAGIIDGQNHTISNLAVVGTNETTGAFISGLNGGQLKNLNFENVNIVGGGDSQARSCKSQTGIVGTITNGGSVSNVHVASGTIKGVDYTGGIVGAIVKSGSVSECSNGANIEATGWYTGGIVGSAAYSYEASDVKTVTDCHNTGNISGLANIGGIVGMGSAVISNCTNSGNLTSSLSDAQSIGGIMGELRNNGSVTGCTNTGTVEITSTNYGFGGIVGWVRYWPEGTIGGQVYAGYPYSSFITVNDNVNYASIKGGQGVAGIVGTWYGMGECNGNKSFAATITATIQFAGSIIGDQQWLYVPTDVTPATLTITNNQTSTSLENGDITAPKCVSQYVYVNSPNNVVEQNNSIVARQEPPVAN